MRTPLVSIIIINWNGKKDIGMCLKSLAKSTYKKFEIILVDNASTDGSVDYVKKYYPYVSLIRNSNNIGFVLAHEQALKIAKGEAILLLNADTIGGSKFLLYLVKRLNSDKAIGVVQPKILLDPDRDLIDSIGSFFLPNGLLYHYGREKDETLPQYNIPFEIFSAKGACMLIKREVIKRVGLFDPDFFAYYEETDFCMRVWMAGWRVFYEPKARVYHKGGRSAIQQPAAFIQFHAYKNALFTYMKNLSTRYLFRILPLFIFYYFLGFMFYMVSGKFIMAFTIARAVWWNVLKIPNTVKKRAYIQRKLRRIHDEDYLPKLAHPVRLSYYYHQFFGKLSDYADLKLRAFP